MWVKLNCAYEDRAAGDWMRVSKGVALELGAAGDAEMPGMGRAELATALLRRIESRRADDGSQTCEYCGASCCDEYEC